MNIPPSIAAFIETQAMCDVLCLPQQYPTADSFEAFQAGYRYHAISAENLTGSGPGDFHESWYVVCSNDFDDPFIVDFSQGDAGYPVYYAHMAPENGSW